MKDRIVHAGLTVLLGSLLLIGAVAVGVGICQVIIYVMTANS